MKNNSEKVFFYLLCFPCKSVRGDVFLLLYI